MRSTNTQRLTLCVSIASGQREVPILAMLNRRVTQMYAGSTKSARQIKRTTADIRADLIQTSSRLDSLSVLVGSGLVAVTSEMSARVDLNRLSASADPEAGLEDST